jgi:MPBQ/MSBQ methyltransferase
LTGCVRATPSSNTLLIHITPTTPIDLRFLYEEWTHPYFISIENYAELIDDTGMMTSITTDDWNKQTIASWRHSVWVGVEDPRGFIFKPRQYLKCVRDGYCLERMHRAFNRGLMQYGMFSATKKMAE